MISGRNFIVAVQRPVKLFGSDLIGNVRFHRSENTVVELTVTATCKCVNGVEMNKFWLDIYFDQTNCHRISLSIQRNRQMFWYTEYSNYNKGVLFSGTNSKHRLPHVEFSFILMSRFFRNPTRASRLFRNPTWVSKFLRNSTRRSRLFPSSIRIKFSKPDSGRVQVVSYPSISNANQKYHRHNLSHNFTIKGEQSFSFRHWLSDRCLWPTRSDALKQILNWSETIFVVVVVFLSSSCSFVTTKTKTIFCRFWMGKRS